MVINLFKKRVQKVKFSISFFLVVLCSFLFLGFVSASNLSINYLGGDVQLNTNHIFNISLNVSCFNGDCGETNVSLDPLDPYVFTTCGQTGNTGPDQSQCDNNYSGTNLDGEVRLNNGIQFWTVPAGVTSIIINVSGASGGHYRDTIPGYGAFTSGTFQVSPGEVLAILVGQSPGNSNFEFAGGGGGSFVAFTNGSDDYSSADPLIVAGGGGGVGGSNTGAKGIDAPATEDGTGDSPGTNGDGAPSLFCSGGGGGFYSNGGDDTKYPNQAGAGGNGFREGGNGGTYGVQSDSQYQPGGFGGGSEADFIGYCNTYGGSGGGYGGGSATSDGRSKYFGEAGGLYNSGTDQINSSGVNIGDGIVTITLNNKGLVSNEIGAKPFYTNLTNPDVISLNNGESQLINFSVNASISPSKPVNYTFFAYANETSDPFSGDITPNWTVTVYPTQEVDFVPSIRAAYNVSNIDFNLSALYFLDGIYNLWWNDGTNNLSYSGEVNRTYSDGIHTIIAYANDSEGNIYETEKTFLVDTIPPSIHITYPTPGVYDTRINELNFSVSDSNLNSCWYSTDDGLTNTSVSCSDTIDVQSLNSGRGVSTWRAYANDSAGTISSDSVTFNVTAPLACGDYVNQNETLTDNLSCEGTALYVNKNNIKIDCNGFTISGGGIQSYRDNTTIENCNFVNSYPSIDFENNMGGIVRLNTLNSGQFYFSNISYSKIKFNNLTNGGSMAPGAVYLGSGSNYTEITDNSFSNSNYGLYLDHSNNNSVQYNDFNSNGYGFYLNYANNNLIGNNFANSTSYSNFGSGSSCPLLYTWNGSQYNFIGDIVGKGILGIQNQDGSYRKPTPADYVSIASDNLKQNGTDYSMQVTEEYDEISYLDELSLATIDHPAGYSVFPTLSRTNYSNFYTVNETLSPAVSCIDSNGVDCTSNISKIDGNYTNGSAGTLNNITVDLGNFSNDGNIKLILNGFSIWTPIAPVNKFIQVIDQNGNWVNVYSGSQLNRPTGFPATYVLDLTGKFKTNDHRVRIGYDSAEFDYVGVDTTSNQNMTINWYHPSSADLHFRGYSEVHPGDVPYPDYYNVKKSASYSSPSGNFTNYNKDVSSLLNSSDDEYVIMHHGDEMTVNFPYVAPTNGTKRDFMLYGYGYYKPANNTNGSTVNPLPFKAMSNYPYSSNEHYPSDSSHNNYQSLWNNRDYSGDKLNVGGSFPYSTNNTVIGNIITGNSNSAGLYFYNENETKILNNLIFGVNYGIYVDTSNNLTLEGNTIVNSSYTGIYFYYGDNSSLLNNTIVNSPNVGIYFDSNSYGNNILHNTIMGNAWIADEDYFETPNTYNDSNSGNTYYLGDGTPSWNLFNLTDSNNDGWSDPSDNFSSFDSTNATGYWVANGADSHPGMSASDMDGDGIPDLNDSVLFNISSVNETGLHDPVLMINNSAVNYSSPLGGDQDVEFYDGNNLLFNFSHNFDVNPIDLSKISINKSDNFIIINTSGQAFTKTVYISDKFDTYCVKDAEITSIAEISSDCTGIDEFKFDSCKGGSQTIGSIYCYDDGTNLIFDGLGHSAILGSNTLSPNSPSTTNTKNNYMDSGGQCITNWSCSNWSICSNGYQNRVCSESIKGCYADPKNKPIENQSCLSNNQNNVIQSNKQIKGSNNYLLWLIVLLVIVFAIFLTSRKIRKIRKGY